MLVEKMEKKAADRKKELKRLWWEGKKPWERTYIYIMNRCVYNKDGRLSYFKKGIKNYITISELKQLWFRDKAYLMKKPSIDRKNSKGNYTFENCRYLELSMNSILKKSQNQYYGKTESEKQVLRNLQRKKVCKRGHILKDPNLYYRKKGIQKGQGYCRECQFYWTRKRASQRITMRKQYPTL